MDECGKYLASFMADALCLYMSKKCSHRLEEKCLRSSFAVCSMPCSMPVVAMSNNRLCIYYMGRGAVTLVVATANLNDSNAIRRISTHCIVRIWSGGGHAFSDILF